MKINFRDAKAEDFGRCVEIRGMTRDNPVPAKILKEIGVTEETWVPLIRNKSIVGVVSECPEGVVGFCNGDVNTGEVLVLAVLPEYEGRDLGKTMLSLVTDKLFSFGLERLWLAASPCPEIRAYGFYRHLGWIPTGVYDKNRDEVLEYKKT
jgi:ribosomal protein S18 acetylase RimI-like enzyme